jgi:YVTN family beta-propeller protein
MTAASDAKAQYAGHAALDDGSRTMTVESLFGDSADADWRIGEFSFPAELHPLNKLFPNRRGPAFPISQSKSLMEPLRDDFAFTGSLPEGDTPSGAAFTPDGAWIVIAHRDSKNLVVFDAPTRAFVKAVALSGSPNGLALSPDGIHAVTANVYENTASIVDLVAGIETSVVTVGNQPGVVRITPDGSLAVVGNTVESTLSVIDIAGATELRRIPGAGFVASVTMAPEPGVVTFSFSQFEIASAATVVHPDYYNSRIQIFDITTGAATTLASDNYPRGVAVTPDGTLAAVTHTSSIQKVSIVDVVGKAISKTIAVGTNLNGPVAVKPDGQKAVVAVLNACRVVNISAGTVSSDLSTASVYDLKTTADGLYVLGVGYYGSLIDFGSEKIVKNLNSIVSTPVGAVSPAGPRAVLVANAFGEDMVVVNTNGSSGYQEGATSSGPPPEGDKARTVAVSPDGRKAVAVNILSDNASIVDCRTGTVDAIVAVGDRPAEVEISPDGTKAVVANLDSTFVSVIDLSTYLVTNIGISRRASQVEISPDGRYAYVAVVADGDGVWRIDLDTLTVDGVKLSAGNMGSVGFLFWQTSGLTLSHDGATLVVCGSFDDAISIIDTASWSLIKTLAVGDFPVRALFSGDDSTIYVTTRDDDTIAIVANAGAGSTVTGKIGVGKYPFEMALAPDGRTLYVMNYSDKNIGVVDLASSMMTDTISLPDSPAGMHLDSEGRFLYAATGMWSVTIGPGPAVSVNMSGLYSMIDVAARKVTFEIDMELPPAMLRFSAHANLAAVASPFGDGIVLVRRTAVQNVSR